MKTKPFALSIIVASVLGFTGCGGGGGGGGSTAVIDTGGIGGTGVSSGVVTGFGSVFVNGVEFETDDSGFEVDDNGASNQGDLSIGMVVKVEGTVNDDGITGTATSITYDANLEGPIADAPTVNADGTEVTFTLLNTPVIVSDGDTTFSNTSLGTLAQGDMVEVSGFYDASGNLRATYVERKGSTFVANSTEIEAKGFVEAFNGTNQFNLVTGSNHSVVVNVSGATNLSDLPNDSLSNGLYVEVKGTMSAANATAINATEIEDEGFEDEQEDVSIQGLVTDFVSISNFKVNGIPVNGANAELEPSNLNVVNGASIEAEGNIVNGILVAEELKGRGGSIEAHANVSAVSLANDSFTISIGDGSLPFLTDTTTRFEDDLADLDGFGLADIASGDFVEVEAYEDADGNLVATRVKREDQDDDELKGPVDAAVANTSITVLDITFSTDGGTEFQDGDDTTIPANDFFAAIDVDEFVKVTDDETADGTADEVEFEIEDEDAFDDEDDDELDD